VQAGVVPLEKERIPTLARPAQVHTNSLPKPKILMSHFPEIPVVRFEGPSTDNPLAFRHYNASEKVGDKTMAEHLRFGAAYWHVMRNGLSDPFGLPTALMPWDDGSDSLQNAINRVPVFFEFLEKTTIPFYCFHDRDISPEGATLTETHKNLDRVVDAFESHQKNTGKKLYFFPLKKLLFKLNGKYRKYK
jgi:xylose isomerase